MEMQHAPYRLRILSGGRKGERNLSFFFLFWVKGLVNDFFSFLGMYNTNGFGTETMYDYYIVIKFMFLIVKLFSHLSIVSTTKTQTTPKPLQTKNLSKTKLQF